MMTSGRSLVLSVNVCLLCICVLGVMLVEKCVLLLPAFLVNSRPQSLTNYLKK